MSGTDDLRDLLDRLKDEVGPLPAPPERPARRPAREPASRESRYAEDRAPRPLRAELKSPEQWTRNSGAGMSWAENKESMLFGTLTSLVAALGGVLGGVDALIYIGAAGFTLFSLLTLLSLAGYFVNSLRSGAQASSVTERVDALSKRVEVLSQRAAAPAGRERDAKY